MVPRESPVPEAKFAVPTRFQGAVPSGDQGVVPAVSTVESDWYQAVPERYQVGEDGRYQDVGTKRDIEFGTRQLVPTVPEARGSGTSNTDREIGSPIVTEREVPKKP